MQEVITAKTQARKMWETSVRQEDRDIYRQANKAANKAVATAKALAMIEKYVPRIHLHDVMRYAAMICRFV